MISMNSDRDDPYLELVSMTPDRVPKDVFPFISQVRRATAWSVLGYPPPRDRAGSLTRLQGCSFEFWTVDLKDPDIVEAIAVQKRSETTPWLVYELLQLGARIEEFIELPGHVVAYCAGRLATDEGRVHDAAVAYREALASDPSQVRYAERLFPALRESGVDDAWREEFAYFAADADHLVGHSVEPWLKIHVARADAAAVHAIVHEARRLMQLLLAGDGDIGVPRRYGAQRASYYQYNATRLEQIIERQMPRLTRAIARTAKVAAVKSPQRARR
jgi:hypothetical protein